jgi:hypothetical protein
MPTRLQRESSIAGGGPPGGPTGGTGQLTDTSRENSAPARRCGLALLLRWKEVERRSQHLATRSRSRKEPVMMFAFALALVGVAVLGTLNLIAAHAH